MSLGVVKLKILRALYAIKAVWYRCCGIKIGERCFISGFPYFFCRKGASIIIGNDVTLHSKKRYNTLISNRITLSCRRPGAVIELHDHCGLSGCKIVCSSKISIGSYTIVGPDTVIYDCKAHDYSPDVGWFRESASNGAPIIIGKRCYIGMGSIILKGVTIGDNCVIAAGSVITKDVPAGHLAQGNPATYTPLPERLLQISE